MNQTAIFEGVALAVIDTAAATTMSILLTKNETLEAFLAGSTPVVSSENVSGLSNSKLIEIIVYMIIWLFGTIGTVLVAYVVLTSRKFKSSTNTHLLNLALADLIYLQGMFPSRYLRVFRIELLQV